MVSSQTDIYDELVQNQSQGGESTFYQDTLKKEAELARLYARKERQATRTRSLTNPRFIELLDTVQGLPFWIEDREEHRQAIAECKELGSPRLVCCFNHAIGLPTKHGIPLPIFDYELQIVKALEQPTPTGLPSKVWIKKARGLGVTELLIRYIVWLCMRDNKLRGNIIFIVTGPRENISLEHILRIERLFEPFGIYSETRQGITEINDVFVQTVPPKNIGGMRGYDRVPLILLDEADFFEIGSQFEARAVAEGYRAKTKPKIVMVSTPNRPDGLFATMEQEVNNGYTKLFLDYTVGLGKIYDPKIIEEEKQQEYFEREYNLRYLGKLGNVFHIKDIEAAIVSEEYKQDILSSVQSTYYGRSMGLDPAWGTSGSNFGIVITQYRNQRVEVIHSEEVHAPYFADVIDHVMQLKQVHHITKIYIDGSAPEVVRELKKRIGEPGQTYEKYTDQQIWSFRNGSWQVIPINFQKRHIQMLNWTNELLQKKMVRILPNMSELLVSLRTARAIEGKLDKKETSYSDVLDAFRLALCNYEAPKI